MSARACIFGCEGLRLTSWERQFFADADPWGFILFARNVDDPDQVRALTSDLRASVGRGAPVFIDQEGGRVARLSKPHWKEWIPPLDQVQRVDTETARRAMRLRYSLIASELQALGIDANCVPMLDVAFENTHPVIRNRCLGNDPGKVALLGRVVADSLLDGGVLPVMKHLPGHGRARQDSHEELPVVETDIETLSGVDFFPFKRLSDLPIGMTAHVLYPSIDAGACATLSSRVIRMIRGQIGFSGLLMTDDLSMRALTGDPARNAEAALAAGCDIALHCNGDWKEMTDVAAAVPELSGAAGARANRALQLRRQSGPNGLHAADTVLEQAYADACNG